MSYLHCHGCHWEQDDFWSWHYNPIRCFWRFALKEYARPRYVSGVHSWWIILCLIPRYIRRAWNMHWWTRRSWVKAITAAPVGCPKCGHRLCED